jgi:hypothetical protein
LLIRFAFYSQISRPYLGFLLVLVLIAAPCFPLPEIFVRRAAWIAYSHHKTVETIKNALFIIFTVLLLIKVFVAAVTVTDLNGDVLALIIDWFSISCTSRSAEQQHRRFSDTINRRSTSTPGKRVRLPNREHLLIRADVVADQLIRR